MEPEEIAEMLENCVYYINSGNLELAAWRLADAGGELRRLIKLKGWSKLAGFDEPTGRGYELPRMVA